MYVVGYDTNSDWRIEKRRLDTGGLVAPFGTSGVVTSSAGWRAFSVSADASYIYIAGDDDQAPQDWRYEKRDLTTGALDSGFGTGGIVTSNSTSETTWAQAIDSDSIYAVGWSAGPDWRVEKRALSDGALRDQIEIDVGTPLAGLNTPATAPVQGTPLRMRLLIHVSGLPLAISGENFKLQFAQRSGTCDTGFSGESYADVTGASVIGYYDNSVPSDGIALKANASDPTHGGDSVIAQTYEELNNFTNSIAGLAIGEDGLWDFALVDNTAPANTPYCLRVVKADGSLLDTYSAIPEVVTAP